MKNKPKKQLLIAAAVVSAAAIIALIWMLAFSNRSLEADARRNLDCRLKGDGGCLMQYIFPEEAKAQDVTEKKLADLLNEYIVPSFSGIKNVPHREELSPDKSHGSVVLSYVWPNNSFISSLICITEENPKEPNLVRTLIYDTMAIKYQRSKDEYKMLPIIRGIKRDASTLTRLGFNGIYNTNTHAIQTWEDLEREMIEKGKQHKVLSEDTPLE